MSAERRARFNRIADEIAVREGLGAVTFKAIYARTRDNRGYAEALYREWLAGTAGFAALMPPALEALSLKLGRETWVLAGIALGRAGRAAAGRAGAGIGPDQNREEDAGGRPPDPRMLRPAARKSSRWASDRYPTHFARATSVASPTT